MGDQKRPPRGKRLPFFGAFGVRLGSLSSASSTLSATQGGGSYVRAHGPKRGFRPSVDTGLHADTLPLFSTEGLHAMSAAITYYHRPGDWREPPNTFNPFWGAKLMPVADFPDLARLPGFDLLLSKTLLVH